MDYGGLDCDYMAPVVMPVAAVAAEAVVMASYHGCCGNSDILCACYYFDYRCRYYGGGYVGYYVNCIQFGYGDMSTVVAVYVIYYVWALTLLINPCKLGNLSLTNNSILALKWSD